MVYNEKLIRLDNKFTSQEDMFTLVLLKAQALMMVLNGIKCFLDGMYLICLDKGEEIKVRKSNVKLQCLYFSPGFINVNLTFELIASKRYLSLCKKHHYPDFYMFRERNDEFLGIIPLTNAEYDLVAGYFSKIDVHIRKCNTDNLWSCHSRSTLFTLFNIANTANKCCNKRDDSQLLPESSYGDEKHTALCTEVIKYIKENLCHQINIPELCRLFSTNRTTLTKVFKAMTGYTPVQYILAERLKQSRLELLFTNIPIYEVAQKYGFHDENYYIRAFKKQYNKTPLAYRKEGLMERIREHQ